MSIELLQTLSTGAFVFAGVLFAAAVALFFVLDVPKLLGDISGMTAKKAIENIRQQNEESGDKAYKPSKVNMARGKLTDKMTPSGHLAKKPSMNGMGIETEKLAAGAGVPAAEETTILSQPAEETTILSQPAEETTILSQPAEETTILSQPAEETTILSELQMPAAGTTGKLRAEELPQQMQPQLPMNGPQTVKVEVAMEYLGSAELIE